MSSTATLASAPDASIDDVDAIRAEGFFTRTVAQTDPAIAAAIADELKREQGQIELIASENIVSRAVLEAQGSVFTNKYAEGYPGKRYYQGCAPSDAVEQLAIDRAKQLFGCGFVNVQPHSGAQANGAVMLALTKPGDTIMGLSLDAGGHLTHGAKPALSGKWYKAVQYGVDETTHLIDYDAVEAMAIENKPTLIIAGGSAYPREIDFARFRAIADKVCAIFMVDMAHFAGLVAGGVHPTPFGHAHVVTTTTHKTLRGPRGGMIMTDDEAIAKKINSAVFPGLQGGPLMHVIAAKAVAFGEALTPEFKAYSAAVVANAKALAARLKARGLDVISGGTDTHLALIDLRPYGISGKDADEALERSHITCNKNGVPGDPLPPTKTSGIRVGSPAGTTRGFGIAEFEAIGDMIADVLAALRNNGEAGDPAVEADVRKRVSALCARFPIYEG
ncbi:serine hydroxymethyltransferase [Sphingobium sp. BS19]|uniref:serine hydroxymethyltransferase n=1 Tax=Sphingobium sp. BS19 TaxID=3018973 RepID=UPI0022EDC66B|nr:serine hydroxymethyltransferase [Sphingobium sp. BS19]GLI96711.1 serine hydroxymethyltransferase [Sphingobium sp. BS19]